MGQLLQLILPAPASLDTIRGCWAGKFDLSREIEGLGAEELQATNESGRTTIFERVPGPVSQKLRSAMQQRSLAWEDFEYFWARYGWATSQSALLCAAETLHGWLYDSWGRLLSSQEFRESLTAANRPIA